MANDPDLYRAIFSRHPHATILFGLIDGLIEDANDAALTLYGYGREELVGRPFSTLAAEPETKLHKRKDGSMLAINAQHSTVNIGGREVGVAVIHALPTLPNESVLDLGDLVTSMVGLTELAISFLPADAPARMDLEEIRRLGLRALKLAATLKA